MGDFNRLFSEVAGSIQPKTLGQWFLYGMTIKVRNDSGQRWLLSTQSSLQIGADGNHPVLAHLSRETTIEAGAEAELAFEPQRVCGKLLAQDYVPTLFLSGHDDQQQPFSETLIAGGNMVQVTQAEQPPILSVGARWYSPFGIPASARRAKVWMQLLTGEDYPNDFMIQWRDGPEQFKVYANDGALIEDEYVFRNITDGYETALVFEPGDGLPFDSLLLIGQLFYSRNLLKCYHEGGTGLGAGFARPRVGVVIGEPTLTLRGAAVTPATAPVGTVVRLEAEVENRKPYTMLVGSVDPAPAHNAPELYWDGKSPEASRFARLFSPPSGRNGEQSDKTLLHRTGLRAMCGGVDVSDRFSVESIGGIFAYGPQDTGNVILNVRVHLDAPLARCTLFPVIDCQTPPYFAFDEQGPTICSALVNGQATVPPIGCDFTPTA